MAELQCSAEQLLALLKSSQILTVPLALNPAVALEAQQLIVALFTRITQKGGRFESQKSASSELAACCVEAVAGTCCGHLWTFLIFSCSDRSAMSVAFCTPCNAEPFCIIPCARCAARPGHVSSENICHLYGQDIANRDDRIELRYVRSLGCVFWSPSPRCDGRARPCVLRSGVMVREVVCCKMVLGCVPSMRRRTLYCPKTRVS